MLTYLEALANFSKNSFSLLRSSGQAATFCFLTIKFVAFLEDPSEL
ncbi:hypothetical protein IKD56_00200 [bacterium]|nr:hypothetical protein [bacterium]